MKFVKEALYKFLSMALVAGFLSITGCHPLLIAGGALTGVYAIATDERSGDTIVDDSTLSTKVKMKLVGDSEVKGRKIDVDVLDGTVILTGIVETNGEAERAVALARSVVGVNDVENNLRLGSRTMGEAFGDSFISSAVKAKLMKEPNIRSWNIDVDVYNGVVSLTGLVESADQKKRIVEIAKTTEGAVRVVDNLRVK